MYAPASEANRAARAENAPLAVGGQRQLDRLLRFLLEIPAMAKRA